MIPSPGSQGDATRKISAFVYLLRSQEGPRYYIGWTTDIRRRLAEHNRRQRSAYISSHRPWQLVGYDGAKRKKGSKVHIAVDTLGHLLALHVTAADQQDRAQVARLAKCMQAATGDTVQRAFVDQGYTGEAPAQQAARHGIQLEVVKRPHVKQGFVLLPRRWVVERSFAWAARFRRLARDYERWPTTLAGIHFLAFAILMLKRFVLWLTQSA